MRRMIHRLGLAVVLVPALVLGCQGGARRLPETGATLEGTVSYGGEKLQFAMVLVQSADKSSSATGKIGEDGRYRVENVPLGEVRVGVNTSAARGDFQSKMMAASQGKAKGQLRFLDVPAKYFDPERSGLTTTVSKGVTTYDIPIPK